MNGRVLAALAAILMSNPPAQAFGGSEVVVETDGGALHGTLTVPDTGGPVPVAFIMPGSGPTDRDGNQPGLEQDVYRHLADGLADAGIASLRIDKRGVGASAAALDSEAGVTIDTYLDDARAWTRMMAADERFSDVFLLGHSEGALYAILVAETEPTAGVVLASGTGRPAAELIRWQLDERGIGDPLRTEAERILVELEVGRTVADPPAALAALFRESVQAYLISWFAIDPAERLAGLDVPVLVLHGTTDLQVPVADARRLAAANETAELAILEGTNHILREAPAEMTANLATYSRPDLPLADGVIPAITSFILTEAGR
ncbi:alpha/beta hydrolase [Microbaculum marinum]|uniref:Alpha/beta fold hydrolase n=1 Tax=Microbaculum marinum TaxID=1764581 RepID=A0AAW9RW36_9HYPH